MNKLLLLLIVLTAVGCSKETVVQLPEECECYKQTLIKWKNSSNFVWNGAEVYYSNDCTDDGDYVGGSSNESYELKYKVKCR